MIRVLLLCAVLGGLTAAQCRVWRSNLTLWTHAVAVSPQLARPAVNLGVAYRKAGDHAQAVRWLGRGWWLASGSRASEMRFVVKQELLSLEAFGYPACSHPDVQPACS